MNNFKMSNEMPIYSHIVPKSQGSRNGKPTNSRVYSSLRPENRVQGRIYEGQPQGFDPLNHNHGGNFYMDPTRFVEKGKESTRRSGHHQSRRVAQNVTAKVDKVETSDDKVEAYLRQNQVNMRQQQQRHSSGVRQAEHRVNLRSLPLSELSSPRGNPSSQDRTPSDQQRAFPGESRSHVRERDRDRERERERARDRERFRDAICNDEGLKNPLSPVLSHWVGGGTTTRGKTPSDKRRFFCREWAFQKLAHCLEQRPVSKTCGALILGDAGSGKTALCQELSQPGSGPQARQQRALNRRLLARHFLEGQNDNSLTMGEFIRTLVMQILSHSTQHRQSLAKEGSSDGNDAVKDPTSPIWQHRNDRDQWFGSDIEKEARRRRNQLEDEDMIRRLRNTDLCFDDGDDNRPLLQDSEDNDDEQISRRLRGTMERIHERDTYSDLLSPSSNTAGNCQNSTVSYQEIDTSIVQDTAEVLPLRNSSNPFINMEEKRNDSLEFRVYENHENVFLRNTSKRQSKEMKNFRLLRQSSEPMNDRKITTFQKSNSTDPSTYKNESDSSDKKNNKLESSVKSPEGVSPSSSKISRIPVANFRYPNKSLATVSSAENSPSKSKVSNNLSSDKSSTEAPKNDETKTVEKDSKTDKTVMEDELPEYQNVFKPKNHSYASRNIFKDPDYEQFKDELVQKTEDVPPPVPSLPVSPRTLIANAYYEKLLSEPDIQQALLPHNLEKNPDDCFKKALLFPLLEIDPPKQCLFLLVDSIDEGSLTKNNSTSTLTKDKEKAERAVRNTNSSKSVAELLANHHHLFPQWLLLVCTARKQSKSLTKMFTGFRKISLDELGRSHVAGDIQRYVLSRLDSEPRLRARVAGDQNATAAAAAALDHLRIKSDGCILYMEKVLDGVAEGFIALRELREIPGTLNGLYLWLAQRLFHGRRFAKVRPLLDVLLAARCQVNEEMLYKCLLTTNSTLSRDDFNRRLHLLRRVVRMESCTGSLTIFHHSFAAWLLDVKHCTRRYLCSAGDGHAALAMYHTLEAKRLSALEIHNYVLHMTRLEQHILAHRSSQAGWNGDTKDPKTSPDPTKSDRSEGAVPVDFHTLVLLWIIDSGCNVETSLRKGEGSVEIGAGNEDQNLVPKTGLASKTSECCTEGIGRLDSMYSLGAQSSIVMNQQESIADFLSAFYRPTLPRDTKVLRALLEMGAHVESGPLLPSSTNVEVETTEAVERTECIDLGTMDKKEEHLDGSRDGLARLDRTSGLLADITASQLSLERQLVWEARASSPDVDVMSLGVTSLVTSLETPVADVTGRTPAHDLAQNGDHRSLLQLLQKWPALADTLDLAGSTPLHASARHGQAACARALLVAGAMPDRADADGWTPLRAAAWGGHAEVVEVLLEFGCQVDCVDQDNRTALRAAAWSGHEPVVRLLLAAGSKADAADAEGRTPLIAAAYMGHADIVAALLDAGANADHADHDGRTGLSVAALCAAAAAAGGGCARAAQLLLERGADVSLADRDGAAPLLVAAFEGHKEICELLLENDADPECCDAAGRTPLWAAASAGHADAVRALLFWGACVDAVDAEGRTVLSVAAAQGNVEVVRQLLDRGLDEHHRDNSGWTPLHYAAFEGHSEVCEALLEAGAKVDEADNDGKGALMLAAQEGHTKLVESLIDDWSAPVDQHAHDGKTAFRLSALEGQFECVRALHERGACADVLDADRRSTLYALALDNRLAMARYLLQFCRASVDTRDSEGRTPLHVSAWQGHNDMVNLLIDIGGAAVDARDLDARTALHAAAWRGRAACVRALLRRGADPAARCDQGATPLGIAAQEGHEECVMWLLQHGADPSQPDHCGRTPAKVAQRAGHAGVCRLLERWGAPPSAPPPPLVPDDTHSALTNTSGSTAETKVCTATLGVNRLSPSPLPGNSQGSPEWKRRSVHSSNSTKSSSNLTSGSTKSSHEGTVSHNNDKHSANRSQLALSFAAQVARCGRRGPGPASHRHEEGATSPLYASPPHSPTNTMHSIAHQIQSAPSDPPPSLPASLNPTDQHFNRDTHMRIILGRDNKRSPPTDGRESRVRTFRAYHRLVGSLGRVARRHKMKRQTQPVKSKRNGIVTNPAMRLVANMRNGLDSAAANIRRTGLNLAASASSANPAVRTNAFQWRRETPL